MRPWYVLWTYIGNYSTRALEIQAKDPAHAAQLLRAMYSPDFARKARIFVLPFAPFVSEPTDPLA